MSPADPSHRWPLPVPVRVGLLGYLVLAGALMLKAAMTGELSRFEAAYIAPACFWLCALQLWNVIKLVRDEGGA